MVFATLTELLNHARTLKESGVESWTRGSRILTAYTRGYRNGSDGHKLFYAEDVDTYFIMWCYKSELVKTLHVESSGEDINY